MHAVGERDRVQIVDQQKRGDERILRQAGRDPLTLLACLEEIGEDPFQPGPLQPDDGRHQLVGQGAR